MTSFQLRRLALQATRRPELMPVLQDALLESPVYGADFANAIEAAHRNARAIKSPAITRWGVVFRPAIRPKYVFDVYGFEEADLERMRPSSWARFFASRGRVIVYMVPVPKRAQRRRRR